MPEETTQAPAIDKKQAAWEKENLVAMAKDGETIAVHPTTVDAHLAAGWKVVE